MTKSLPQATAEVIDSMPYMRYSIEEGVVNYASLARKVKPRVEKILNRAVSTDAVTVAVRRYAENIKKGASFLERKLKKLLSETQINLKNEIADVTFKKGTATLGKVKPIHFASGSTADTVVVNQKDLRDMKTQSAIKVRENLVEISIITPPEVEEIPGFVQYVTGKLAENNINIVEVVSCYTDTILLVKESDAMRAYNILKDTK